MAIQAQERAQKAKEHEEDLAYRRQEQRNSHQRQMAQIAAYRSISEKRATNQPQTNIYLTW